MPPIDVPGRMMPSEMAALFARYGVRPEPGLYLGFEATGRPCGCPVGIRLVHAAGGFREALDAYGGHATAELCRQTRLPMAYVDGLDDGFSWPEESDPGREGDAAYAAGFADGLAVAALLLEPTERRP